MSDEARPRLAHVPALDGLRGVAVLGVVAFHAGHLRGGFLGVDLFFVLSGFLITSLLLVEHEGTGTIALGSFWARRFRRLLPALLAVLVAVAAYGWLSLPDTELAGLRRDALATLGYVANWVSIASGGDYWAAYASPSPLEHTWSLAIEEQFYVVWPLVVAAVLWLARGRRGPLVTATAGLAALSLASLVLHHDPGGDTSRAYYGTDTRIAAILYGAVLAALVTGRSRRADRAPERLVAVLAPVAAVVLGVAWATTQGTSPWLYEWGFPLLGVSVAVVIAALTGPLPGPLGRLLEWRPLRHMGIVSYGLYLWHWPVFVVLDADRVGVDGWPLTALRVAASMALAELSLRLVERPVRSGARPSLARWPVALGAMASTAVVLVVATIGAVERPAATLAGAAEGAPVVPDTGEPRILLLGDSGAALLGEGMVPAGAEVGVDVIPRGTVGCGIARSSDGVVAPDGRFFPDPEGCDDWPTRWEAELAAAQPDATLLFLAWAGVGDRLVDGEAVHPCDETFDRYYRQEVDTALDLLGAERPVLLATVPYATGTPEHAARVDCLNATYRAAVEDHPGASLVDLAGWVCPDGTCRQEDEGVELRPDGLHFEGAGAVQAGRWLVGEVSRQVPLPGA